MLAEHLQPLVLVDVDAPIPFLPRRTAPLL